MLSIRDAEKAESGQTDCEAQDRFIKITGAWKMLVSSFCREKACGMLSERVSSQQARAVCTGNRRGLCVQATREGCVYRRQARAVCTDNKRGLRVQTTSEGCVNRQQARAV